VPLAFSSLHLKESFEVTFLLELGGLGLDDLLFSTEGTVDWRQGKQLLGRIPQLSNIPSSLPRLPSTDEEISSRNTGWFASFIGPSHLGCESKSSEFIEAWKFCVLETSQPELPSELPDDKPPGFWIWLVEEVWWLLTLQSPWLTSLRDEILDLDVPSKPFRDNKSADIIRKR
jgi:hypothetical protein